MKYRLKDRDFQRRLDEISGGDFSKALDISAQRLIDVYEQDGLAFSLDTDRVFVSFGSAVKACTQEKQFRACFEPGTIEPCKQYDPKKWNEWAEVDPPKDVVMRVEIWTKGKRLGTPEPRLPALVGRAAGYFDGRAWILSPHLVTDEDEFFVRYRPWDDEEKA